MSNLKKLTNENIRDFGNSIDGLMQAISTKFTGEISGVKTVTNNIRNNGGAKVISSSAAMTKGTAVIKVDVTVVVNEIETVTVEDINGGN